MRLIITVMLMALAANANAQSSNKLDTFRQSYEQQRQGHELQYGKALDTIKATVKKKGDLDALLILQAEQNRFRSERIVPAPTDAKDLFRSASQEYWRGMIALLERYVTALDALIKTEVTADRIEEAKVVKTEKDRAVFILADMQTKVPAMVPGPTSKADPFQKAQPPIIRRLVHPPDAQQFGQHWYKAFNEVVSWDEAVKRCKTMKGYLCCVTSDEENVFVAGLTAGKAMWLGASDARKEGEWTWVSGEEFLFNKWFPGQPANDGGNSHYLHIGVPWKNRPQDWNDGPLNLREVVGFICEWEQ